MESESKKPERFIKTVRDVKDRIPDSPFLDIDRILDDKIDWNGFGWYSRDDSRVYRKGKRASTSQIFVKESRTE